MKQANLRFEISVLAVFLLFFLGRCIAPCVEGTGEVINEKRAILSFTEIELRCDAEVEMNYQPKTRVFSVIVEAQENLMPFIITRVEDGKLIVDTEQCIKSADKVKMTLPVTRIEGLLNSGSGKIFSSGMFGADDIEVVNEGSGHIEVGIKGDECEIYNYGSGNIIINGFCEKLKALNSGSGDLELRELLSNEARVKNEGSGLLTFWAEDNADMELTGSGSIGYKGYPPKIKQDENGSGNIYRLD